MNETELAVRLVNVTKRFPGVTANDSISLAVRVGEVHALLGENGAGKSTLMSILAGLYQPDEGQIFLWDKPSHFRSPADAIEAGVGMVWQHFKLVPNQTVAENVALGLHHPRFGLGLKAVEKKLAELSAQHGLEVKPTALIRNLSVGEQQRVEIIKTLYYGAKVLILDEPTANLTPPEASGLFKAMRRLAEQGYAIIFISHKLDEIGEVANRATILKAGKAVATLPIEGGEAEKRKLAALMVGGSTETSLEAPLSDHFHLSTKVLLAAKNISVFNDQAITVLNNLSLQVDQGEIVSVVGVAGNGQRELAEALAGLRRIESGRVYLGDRDLTNKGSRLISRLGLAFVPEDRLSMGSAAGLNLEENFILKSYWQSSLKRGPFISWGKARQQLAEAVSQYDVRVGNLKAPARLLSGGNLQKLLLAREIGSDPKALIVANPTRGLDIGATRYVQNRLIQQAESGTAILLITEDLDEALALGNRVLVLYRGRITGELPAQTARQSLSQIGFWMTGARAKAKDEG